MSKWQKVKLGELYDVHNGLSKSRDAFGSGYPFLSFSEVFNNYFLPDELKQLVETTPQEQESYSIHRGDVFITRTSETMDELGMSCVALQDYPKATYNGFTKRLRPKNQGSILPEYVGYFLRTPLFRSKFVAFSTMTTRASLRNEDLLAMEISLPPIEVQRKIADVLSAYDDLIENNRKQIRLLEEAAQRLYKEWFIDLRFHGYENTKIINSIPDGWERKKLGEWVNTFSGGTPSRKNKEFYQNGSNFWLKTQELTDSFIFETEEKITDRAIEYSSAKYIYPNSIIMAMYGATIGKLGIAATRLTCNQACCVFDLSSQPDIMPYLYLWLKLNRDFFISQGIGSAQSNLSQAMIKNFDIVVPCQEVLSDFSQIATKIFARILKLQKSVNEAKNARDRLLPKLMSGELEVK